MANCTNSVVMLRKMKDVEQSAVVNHQMWNLKWWWEFQWDWELLVSSFRWVWQVKELMFHQVMGKHYFNPYIHYILMENTCVPAFNLILSSGKMCCEGYCTRNWLGKHNFFFSKNPSVLFSSLTSSKVALVRVAVCEMSTWGPQSFTYSWMYN